MTEYDKSLSKFNITIKSRFVPFSKSRNCKNDSPSLNWQILLTRNDVSIGLFDYSQGYGHCPAIKKGLKAFRFKMSQKYFNYHAALAECEKGYVLRDIDLGGNPWFSENRITKPKLAEVLYSLILDASVSNYDNFESWALEYGYDLDSRQAYTIYEACLEIGLELLKIFSETELTEIRDILQDY